MQDNPEKGLTVLLAFEGGRAPVPLPLDRAVTEARSLLTNPNVDATKRQLAVRFLRGCVS
jgi:hypothetical protein